MCRRFLRALPVVSAALLLNQPIAGLADTPRYSFVGASYEWTDVKYGVGTQNDLLNSGRFEGVNLEGSIGLVDFVHVAAEYFDADCANCFNPGHFSPGSTLPAQDLDFSGFKAGVGVNPTLGFIGSDNTDFVLRVNYVDVELEGQGLDISSDGYSVEAGLRSQVSERAEVYAGYEYFDVDDTSGTVVLGLGYELGAGVTFLARGIVFNNEAGLDLGLRWYFGSALFGDGDSVVRR